MTGHCIVKWTINDWQDCYGKGFWRWYITLIVRSFLGLFIFWCCKIISLIFWEKFHILKFCIPDFRIWDDWHFRKPVAQNVIFMLLKITVIHLWSFNSCDMFFCWCFSVLKAINEDSPTVPTLLTDYILKGEWVGGDVLYM